MTPTAVPDSQSSAPAGGPAAPRPPPRRGTGVAAAIRARWTAAALALLVAALASFLLFHRLGAASLHGDEALHAQVARESAARDEPPRLFYRDGPYVSKPPLKILAVGWIFERFGDGELQARAIDAACGVATALVVFLFGRRLWGNTGWGLAAALLGSLLLLTSEHYVFRHGVRAGVQDSALVLATTVSLALYFLWRQETRNGTPGGGRWHSLLLIGAGIAAGCGGLVKGPVVALVPAVVAVWELSALLRRRRPRPGGLAVVILFSLAPYLAWLAAADSWTGGRLRKVLYAELVERNTAGVDPGHLHGPLFYPSVLGADFGWWLLALVPALALIAGWRVGRAAPLEPAAQEPAAGDRRSLAYLALWAALLVGIPSLSVSKLPWYIYPAYPALGLLCARGVVEAVRTVRFRSRWLAAALAVGVVLGAWQRIEAVRERTESEPRIVRAHRYARVLADLPSFRLIIDARHPLPPWELYYLSPIGELRRNVPPEVERGIPGVCRFLVRGAPDAPRGVTVREPGFAVRPLSLGADGEPGAYLLDLDGCLPVWV